MENEEYKELKDTLKEMQSELSDLNERMEYHVQCIRQDDAFVHSFFDDESEDYKIFSPRTAKDVHKNEITRSIEDRKSHQQEYDELFLKAEILKKRIRTIEKFLDFANCDISILNLLETDRKRIARELHDSSLQNLTHLVHKIELSSLYMDKDIVNAKLELSVVIKILKETIDEIRNTIFNLRPMAFDDLGLKAAVERLIFSVNESKRFQIEQQVEDVSCKNDLVLLSVYRIIQECVNNIQKHSQAEKIWINCKSVNDVCIIDVSDDGIGMDSNMVAIDKHFGILMMKERVELLKGTIRFSALYPSKKDGNVGTHIHIEIPLICK